jgi:galactokinase
MSTSGELTARATSAFTERFGAPPAFLGCAPGRVELLGNHTDYNGGLVMAVAVDRFTITASGSLVTALEACAWNSCLLDFCPCV